jgi:esterase/lipase superfamily enzyme
MSKLTSSWHSPRIEREVTVVRWGTFGTPVLVFPTAGGDAEEIERFHLVAACSELIDAGRVKLYSVDSVNGRVLLAGEGDAGRQAWIQRQFFEFLRHEVVPAIRTDCASDDIDLVASGSSIGAFNALTCVCRFPDVFKLAICMSGTFDLRRFFPGPVSADYYESSPLNFVPAMEDGETLDRLRQRLVVLASGEGANEDIGESWAVADVLGAKGIPNRVDSWGPEWEHDWPLWRAMLPGYLNDLA